MYKTNLNYFLKLSAVLGLFLAHQHLRATTVTNILTVTMSTIVPGAEIQADGSPVKHDFVNKQPLTSKKILEYLADATSSANVAAAGNYIEVVLPDAGTNIITVKDKTGAVLLDASAYITITLGNQDIFAGTSNDTTLQQTRTTYRLLTFKFDDLHGKEVEVTGLATDRYTATAKNNGIQRETGTLSAPVSGSGSLDGLPAVASGTILLRGKGVLTD